MLHQIRGLYNGLSRAVQIGLPEGQRRQSNRKRRLETSTAPTKAKWREKAYSLFPLTKIKSIGEGVKIKRVRRADRCTHCARAHGISIRRIRVKVTNVFRSDRS